VKKENKKQTLKLTLLFMDIIVLVAIFFGVIFLFEFVIKDILVKYSVNKFLKHAYCSIWFNKRNKLYWGKKDLPYEENVNKVLII